MSFEINFKGYKCFPRVRMVVASKDQHRGWRWRMDARCGQEFKDEVVARLLHSERAALDVVSVRLVWRWGPAHARRLGDARAGQRQYTSRSLCHLGEGGGLGTGWQAGIGI
jgi:hypothetical protein